MTARRQYTNRDLGSFSEWHRSELCDWYRWIDIDYLGYQIVDGDYSPYVAVERIRLTNTDPRDGPAQYPLDSHKREVYEQVADGLDIPAFSMWHRDKCDIFVLIRIDNSEPVATLEGKDELMTFFDDIAAEQFGGLQYR